VVPAQAIAVKSTSKLDLVAERSERIALANPRKSALMRAGFPAAFFVLALLPVVLIMSQKKGQEQAWYENFSTVLLILFALTFLVFILCHVAIRLLRSMSAVSGNTDLNPVRMILRVHGQLVYLLPWVGAGGLVWSYDRYANASTNYYAACGRAS